MRRQLAVLGAVALVGLSSAVVASGSANGVGTSDPLAVPTMRRAPADRASLRQLDDVIGRKPARLPAYLHRDESVTATVLLSGDAVADAIISEREQGRTLGRAQRAAKRGAVAGAQAPTIRLVKASGATVLYTMQDAVNALVVRATPSQLAAIASVPGVVAVERSHRVQRDNTNSNNATGASTAWEELGITGAGQSIAIIDTGVDYLHADFGGSGSAADFASNDSTIIEPDSFPTPKVIGGYDFVGDDYNAASDIVDQYIPHPDPDPLDCYGHGTHVAGTAAGLGVKSDGSTFTGPYTKEAVASLKIGPGSAPGASLLAYRIFGCDGDTDSAIIVAALDRALRDGATVANLSLGSSFGLATDIDAVAVNRVSRAGMLVVASAGNDGHAPYLVGSPAIADRALAVAALDTKPDYPAATLTLPDTSTMTLLNGNDATFSFSKPVVVLHDGAGGMGHGCSISEFPPEAEGAIVVLLRGVCPRADRLPLLVEAKAAGGIMVNNAPGYPPFDGPVPGISIPLLGATDTDGTALAALDGLTVAAASTGTVPNAHFMAAADFTSGGPRPGDSAAKPDVSAPGEAIYSAAIGTGDDGVFFSGTSMAAPHTSGVAALVRAAHPTWNAAEVKAAIMNTATANDFQGYSERVQGTGLVRAVSAIEATTVAVTNDGTDALSFGFESSRGRIDGERRFTLVNHAAFPVAYELRAIASDAFGERVRVEPTSVVIPAGGKRNVKVRLTMSKDAMRALPGSSFNEVPADSLTTVHGMIVALPTSLPDTSPVASGTPSPPIWNAVRVPYLLVPKAESNIEVGPLKPLPLRRPGSGFSFAKVRNNGVHAGAADVYAWQLSDRRGDAPAAGDLVSAGIQTYDVSDETPDRLMVLAVAFAGQRTSAASGEIDVLIDTDDDGEPDHLVFGMDSGYALEGYPNGQFASFVLRLSDLVITGAWASDAPYNGSTVLLPFLASELGMHGTSAMRYSVQGYEWTSGAWDEIPDIATWDPFNPAVVTGQGTLVDAGGSGWLVFSDLSRKAARAAGVRGYLVVTLDDRAGNEQVERVDFR